MTKVSETISAARAMIANPKHWTQGAHARTATGDVVGISDEGAVCFCADGALALAAGLTSHRSGVWLGNTTDYNAASDLLCEAASEQFGEYSYISVNDANSLVPKETAHANIMALMERGIDLAKSREELNMTRVAP